MQTCYLEIHSGVYYNNARRQFSKFMVFFKLPRVLLSNYRSFFMAKLRWKLFSCSTYNDNVRTPRIFWDYFLLFINLFIILSWNWFLITYKAVFVYGNCCLQMTKYNLVVWRARVQILVKINLKPEKQNKLNSRALGSAPTMLGLEKITE